MLDTVILQIPIQFSAITDPNKFNPNARQLEVYRGFGKCTNNPTAEDRRKEIYKPKLTLIKRGEMIYLKIEFSAPKLLFGNNLDEIKEKDFDEMITKLQKVVKEMGVLLWTHQIEKAKVIGFHPSKNIVLTNGYTSSFAIRELFKINLNQKLDLTMFVYRNNGEELQVYSNCHSCVFYDKINDLNKPAKRAVDKDQTKQQIDLFEYIKKEKRNLEILRFEVRLSYKDKMKEILGKIGFTDAPLFKNIFKKDLCQKIVKLYWEEFFGKNLFLFSVNNNPQMILQKILMKYPKTNIRTAVMLVGLNVLCKDEEGIRGLRSIAKNYKPKFNWIMLNNYLRKFEDEIFTKPTHGFIRDIEVNLDNFGAFRLNRK